MRLISFDVFDTLLIRTCVAPQDVFVRLGERLRGDGLTGFEPRRFAEARRRAERDARRKAPGGEAELDDIYALLASRLAWDDSQRAAASAIELALEREGIRPVILMRPQVRQARKEAGRVLFISDMYLPSAVIRDWLGQAGFWEDGDLIYVSGENGASKSSGRLFEKIRTELRVEFGHWTHHGDHPQADVARPRRVGLTAHSCAEAVPTARERRLRGRQEYAPTWRSLLAGAARLARLDQPAPADDPRRQILWETGTSVAGPLFHGFTGWCLAEAERRGVEDLYFLARGGQILLQVAREIQRRHPRPIRLHYLPGSRLAFIGPDYAADPEKLRTLTEPKLVFHSARQTFANLGIDEADAPEPPWLPRAEWARNLAPAERAALTDWLLEPERLQLVKAALAARADRARAYLAQSGLSARARAGLVDTGWMGTTHQNIETLLGEPGAPAALTGFYLGLVPVREFHCNGPMLGYTNAFARLPLRRINTLCTLLELFAQGDHGQVRGFARDEARQSMAPQFGPIDPARSAEVVFFQAAVLAFVGRAHEAGAALAGAPAAELARVATGNYLEFHRRPTKAEVLVFGRMAHSDQLLEQHCMVLCPEMQLGEILGAMLHWRRRPPCWWVPGQARLGHAPVLFVYLGLKRVKWWLLGVFAGKPD